MLIFCLFRCIRIHIYCFFLCVLSCNFPLLPRSTQSLCRHHCLKIIILPYNVWACKNKRQVFSVFVFAFVNKCGKILILIFIIFSFVILILKKKLTVLWIGEASGLSQKVLYRILHIEFMRVWNSNYFGFKRGYLYANSKTVGWYVLTLPVLCLSHCLKYIHLWSLSFHWSLQYTAD